MDEQPANPALQLLEQAYQAARAAVDQAETPQRALEVAGAFFRCVVKLKGQSAGLRAETAARIWEGEEFTLAEVGEPLGVNKARAAQIVAEGQASRKEQ